MNNYTCIVHDSEMCIWQDDGHILRIGNNQGFYCSFILTNETLKNVFENWLKNAINIERLFNVGSLQSDPNFEDTLYNYSEFDNVSIEFSPIDVAKDNYGYNLGILANNSTAYIYISRKDNLKLIVALQVWIANAN